MRFIAIAAASQRPASALFKISSHRGLNSYQCFLHEVNIQVRSALIGLVVGLHVILNLSDGFLADIGRVSDNRVEPTSAHDIGESVLSSPVESVNPIPLLSG